MRVSTKDIYLFILLHVVFKTIYYYSNLFAIVKAPIKYHPIFLLRPDSSLSLTAGSRP